MAGFAKPFARRSWSEIPQQHAEVVRELTAPVSTALLPELHVPVMGVALCIESYTMSCVSTEGARAASINQMRGAMIILFGMDF